MKLSSPPRRLYLLLIAVCIAGSCTIENDNYDVDQALKYCMQQLAKTLKTVPDANQLPRTMNSEANQWQYVNYKDWTSGFWPGILWYAYESSNDQHFLKEADRFSRALIPLSVESAADHDLGFQIYNSFGNGYRLTGNEEYKAIILATADTLATLYNPTVGTILSWPRSVPNMEWPQHNTIIDNMINLELLFWAAKNGGSKKLYEIAVKHAETTMHNHFRDDYTSYHVVIYDKKTGEKIKAVTHQGFADNSLWARGQAWAIYGYTMCYRETRNTKFLHFAQKVADVYLQRLPEDLVPYWDFDDPAIPKAPRDASAAAITASALLELSTLVAKKEGKKYFDKAVNMLESLAKDYHSDRENMAFLKHITGNKPNKSEIDVSINYADYYYIEALLRLNKVQKNGKL